MCFPSKESIKEPKKIDTGAALLDAAPPPPPQLLDGDNVTTVKIPGLWPCPTPKEQRHTHTRVCVYNVSQRERAVPSSSRDPFMCVQKDPSHVIHYSIRRREKRRCYERSVNVIYRRNKPTNSATPSINQTHQ